MFILFNDTLLQDTELRLPVTDRAFQFNDGFFETAILENGHIRFWEQHKQRMLEGAKALRLELPASFFEPAFEQKLLQLAIQENADKYSRLKLKVWRAGAGLYTPQTNSINWLASINPAAPSSLQPLQIGICRQVQTSFNAFSHIKGPNAPLYVLAGLEKKEQNQDDMLLLDKHGNVAELISSNIFWLKDNILYTPALETGCVNGILRREILMWCSQQSMHVEQVMLSPGVLLEADAVFVSNVTGIRGVESINGSSIQQQEVFIERLRLAFGLSA